MDDIIVSTLVKSIVGSTYGTESKYYSDILPTKPTYETECNSDHEDNCGFGEMEVVVRLTPRCDGRLKIMDRRETERFYAALQYAIMNNISMREIADRCCLSLSTFKRRFKERVGGSPHEWIIAKRMEIAYNLIAQSDITISSLAKLCCYSNTSHFIEVFKNFYGITPLALRRKVATKSACAK